MPRPPLEYAQPGERAEDQGLTRASERLIRLIKKIGIRKLVRIGFGRRMLEKIYRRQPVSVYTLQEYESMVQKYRFEL